MRKSTIAFFVIICIQLCLLIGLLNMESESEYTNFIKTEKLIVQEYNLTDFCLSTESRHTRHISQPELMAPFQDLPGFHDHFPSSSFFGPPDTSLWRQDK